MILSNWYIDEVNGNDSNTGTSPSAALKTWDELTLVRWGKGAVLKPGTGNTIDVTALSDCTVNNPLNLDVRLDAGVSLKIHGARTIKRSGTVTGATDRVYATNTPYQLTDSGVVNWSTDVDHLVVMTSGASVGNMFWIDKDLGGGNARATTPILPLALTRGALWGVGDTYNILNLSTLFFGAPPVVIGTDTRQNGQIFQIDGFTLDTSLLEVVQTRTVSIPAKFFECKCNGFFVPVGGLDFAGTISNVCSVQGWSVVGNWTYNGGLVHRILHPNGGSQGVLQTDTLVTRGFVQYNIGSRIDILGLGVFDSPAGTSGIVFFSNCALFFEGGNLWGSGNALYGISGGVNSTIVIANPGPTSAPTITGASGDYNTANGNGTDFAFDPVTATYITPARTLSWANIFTPVASGGFGVALAGGSYKSPKTGDAIGTIV